MEFQNKWNLGEDLAWNPSSFQSNTLQIPISIFHFLLRFRNPHHHAITFLFLRPTSALPQLKKGVKPHRYKQKLPKTTSS